MDHGREAVTIFDDARARRYRQADVLAVGRGSRRHYCDALHRLCESFGRKIDVLDVGCGSGRYFHCLRNVRQLTGIDISPHMLEQARDPIHGEALDVEALELLCGDIRTMELPDRSFDLIYSIGVVGEYCPVDDVLLERLARLLAPRGMLFFTTVDVYSRLQMPENARLSLSRRALRKCFPLLPPAARRAVNRGLSSYYVTETQLVELLHRSPFTRFTITRYQHPSGWKGTHFDCLATTS